MLYKIMVLCVLCIFMQGMFNSSFMVYAKERYEALRGKSTEVERIEERWTGFGEDIFGRERKENEQIRFKPSKMNTKLTEIIFGYYRKRYVEIKDKDIYHKAIIDEKKKSIYEVVERGIEDRKGIVRERVFLDKEGYKEREIFYDKEGDKKTQITYDRFRRSAQIIEYENIKGRARIEEKDWIVTVNNYGLGDIDFEKHLIETIRIEGEEIYVMDIGNAVEGKEVRKIEEKQDIDIRREGVLEGVQRVYKKGELERIGIYRRGEEIETIKMNKKEKEEVSQEFEIGDERVKIKYDGRRLISSIILEEETKRIIEEVEYYDSGEEHKIRRERGKNRIEEERYRNGQIKTKDIRNKRNNEVERICYLEDGRVENVKGDFKERRELGIPGREDILRKEEIKREDKEEYQKIILRDGRILVKKTRRYEGFGDGRDMGKDRLTKWERERIGSKFIFHIGSRVRVSETAYEKREKNGEEIEEIYVEMRNEEDGILKKIEPGHMRIDNAVEIGELLFLDLVLGCTNRGDVGLDRNQMSIDQEGVIHAMGRRMSLDRMYRFLIEDRDKDLEYLKGDGALLIMKKYEDIIKNIVKDFIEEKSEFLEEGIFKREDFEIFNYQVGRKVFRGEEIKRKIYEGFIIGMRNFHNKYDKRWLRIEGIESKVAEEIEIFEEIYEGIKGVILKELIERERIEIKLEGGKKKRVRVYQDIYLRREEIYGEGGEIEEKIFFNKEGDIERREILDKRGEVIIATKYSADKKKEEYVNGVLEKVTEYEGGIVKKEEKYDAKGGFVRKRTLYDGEGKKEIEEEYKGERKISERKYKEGGNKREGYDERGNVISLVKYDREWKKEGEAYWAWEEGEILAHIGMVLGLKEERRKVEGMYHEDEKEGEWRYYNRHGELVKEIRWEKGEIKEEKNKKAVRGVLQWEDEEGIERHEEVKTFINGRNFSKLEIFQDIVGKRGYRGGNKAEEEVNIERIELRGGREVIRKSRIRKQERGVAAKDLNFDKERLKREEIATRIMKYILRSTDAPNAKYVIGEERGELIEELYIEQMIREVDFKFEVEKISVSAGHLVQIGEIMFVDMLLGNRRRLWEGCNTKDMLNDGERIFPINTTFSKEGMMATVSESGKDKKNHEYLKDLKDIMIKVIGEYSQEGKSKYLEGRITSNSAFKEVLELISLNYDLGILMKEITEGFYYRDGKCGK